MMLNFCLSRWYCNSALCTGTGCSALKIAFRKAISLRLRSNFVVIKLNQESLCESVRQKDEHDSGIELSFPILMCTR